MAKKKTLPGLALLIVSVALAGCGSSEPDRLTIDYSSSLVWQESVPLSGKAAQLKEVRVTVGRDSAPQAATVGDGRWSYTATGLPLGDSQVAVEGVDGEGKHYLVKREIRRYQVPTNSRGVEVVAHRGASLVAPENTISALHLAWLLGADLVEVDARLTRDRQVVVIHDPTTDRVSGSSLVVEESDAAALRSLDVGSAKGEAYAGERIPTLDEVLAAVPPGKKVMVEIKTENGMVPYLADAIRRSGKSSQVMVHSFYLPALIELKRSLPEVPLLLLTDFPDQPLVQGALREKMAGLNLRSDLITADTARRVRGAGLKLYAWTVNDRAAALHFHQLGVTGLLTDDPQALADVLGP